MDIEFDFKGDPIGGVITNCESNTFHSIFKHYVQKKRTGLAKMPYIFQFDMHLNSSFGNFQLQTKIALNRKLNLQKYC